MTTTIIQNAFNESFNGRLRDECLNQSVFHNIHHARAVIESCVQRYNQERPHSSPDRGVKDG